VKLKIGRNEAYDTGDPWPHLEIERSKVKVTDHKLTTNSVSKWRPQLAALVAPPGE